MITVGAGAALVANIVALGVEIALVGAAAATLWLGIHGFHMLRKVV